MTKKHAPTLGFATSDWLTSVPTKSRAPLAVAADVADVVEALHAPNPGAAQNALNRILMRAADLPDDGVPVAAAAQALDVTPPTVRTWIERGVLESVEGPGTVKVTAASLGEAVAAARTIRSAGKDGRLLTELLREIEDRRTVAQIGEHVAELERGDIEWIESDRVADLFV